MKSAMMRGIDSTSVRTVLGRQSPFGSGESLSMDKVNTILTQLKGLGGGDALDKRSQDFLSGIKETELASLAQNPNFGVGGVRSGLIERAQKDHQIGFGAADKLLTNFMPDAKEALGKQNQKQERSDQVRADLAKMEIINMLKLKNIKLDMLSDDEKVLAMGRAMNNLTQGEILDFEKKIALKVHDKDLQKQLSGFIQEEVKGIEKLTLSDAQRGVLAKTVAKINLDDLATQEGLALVMSQINVLEGATKDEGLMILETLQKKVKGAKDESAAKKEITKDTFKQRGQS